MSKTIKKVEQKQLRRSFEHYELDNINLMMMTSKIPLQDGTEIEANQEYES